MNLLQMSSITTWDQKKVSLQPQKKNEAVFLILNIKNLHERVRILMSLLFLKLFIDIKTIFLI